MPAKLGELLVDNGLIVPPQLEQALQAQLVFGGRLGTNLVELGFISTATLAAFLAQQLAIPALRPGELDEVDPQALKLVDAELAEKHLVFPLSVQKRRLRLAMADPTDLSAADEIAFRTGYGIDSVVAPELLVMYALERFYDIKKANRFVRLSETAESAAASFSPQASAKAADGDAFAAPPQRKGPYGIEEASEDLVQCESYGGVLEVLKRLLGRDLQRVAIFVIEGAVARGWSHRRCEVPSEILRDGVHDPFRQIEIPVAESLVFRRITDAGAPLLSPLRISEADRVIPKLLRVGPKDPVLGFALRAAGRTAAIALGAGERREGSLASRERFDLMVSKAEDAIHLVHLRKRILGG